MVIPVDAARTRLLSLFADILDYPGDGLAGRVAEGRALLAEEEPEAARLLGAFADVVAATPPGRLEEIYTGAFDLDTLSDLDATCYPYVGHHLFGESYKRSAFLVGLAERYRAHGFAPPPGELPDHLVVILRFLAGCPDQGLVDEIVDEALLPALRRMVGEEGGRSARPSGKAAYLAALRALLVLLEAWQRPGARREQQEAA